MTSQGGNCHCEYIAFIHSLLRNLRAGLAAASTQQLVAASQLVCWSPLKVSDISYRKQRYEYSYKYLIISLQTQSSCFDSLVC